MMIPSHPSEVEYDAEDRQETISVTDDDARPGWVLVGIGGREEHKAGIYLTAHQARSFAAALVHYADGVQS